MQAENRSLCICLYTKITVNDKTTLQKINTACDTLFLTVDVTNFKTPEKILL